MTCIKHCYSFCLTNEFGILGTVFFESKLKRTGLKNVVKTFLQHGFLFCAINAFIQKIYILTFVSGKIYCLVVKHKPESWIIIAVYLILIDRG